MKKTIFLLLLFLPFTMSAVEWSESAPGDFSAHATFSSSEVDLQQPLKVTLVLTYPKNYHVDLERLKDNLLWHNPLKTPPFLLSSFNEQREEVPEDSIKHELVYVLKPQVPGDFSLTFFSIQFLPNEASAKVVEIISEIVSVKIIETKAATIPQPMPLLNFTSALPIAISNENRENLIDNPKRESESIAEIRHAMEKSALPWLELGVLLLTIAMLLAMQYAPTLSQKPPETPERRALRIQKEALARIEKYRKEFLANAQYAPFYVGAADVLRHYIDQKYQTRMERQTTPEFLQSFEQQPLFEPETATQVRKFLLNADQVKFALRQPTLDECESAVSVIQSVVSST